MAERGSKVTFGREPLRFLDQMLPAAGDAFWLTGRQLLVAEVAAAKAVLANADGLYQEHSDFFHTRKGTFGPRSAQVAIGRGSKNLLRAKIDSRAGDLADSVRRALVPSSEWPDAGNWLFYRHLRGALVAPGSPERLRLTLDEVVERAVLAGARERYSPFARALFRRRVLRVLAQTLEERRRRGASPPADLLDVVVDATDPEVPAALLAELYLGFVFAVAGSVGFTLGWSLYLLGTNPPTGAEPAWVVREALRLWPVAWLLDRRPARRHELAGVEVTPRDDVIVCPYVVHRHPRYWEEPTRFLPERWAAGRDQQAFIPFGWGPHTCIAASLAFELVQEVLTILRDGYRLTVTPHTNRPFIGPALAPPRFTLGLVPHRP